MNLQIRRVGGGGGGQNSVFAKKTKEIRGFESVRR